MVFLLMQFFGDLELRELISGNANLKGK